MTNHLSECMCVNAMSFAQGLIRSWTLTQHWLVLHSAKFDKNSDFKIGFWVNWIKSHWNAYQIRSIFALLNELRGNKRWRHCIAARCNMHVASEWLRFMYLIPRIFQSYDEKKMPSQSISIQRTLTPLLVHAYTLNTSDVYDSTQLRPKKHINLNGLHRKRMVAKKSAGASEMQTMQRETATVYEFVWTSSTRTLTHISSFVVLPVNNIAL